MAFTMIGQSNKLLYASVLAQAINSTSIEWAITSAGTEKVAGSSLNSAFTLSTPTMDTLQTIAAVAADATAMAAISASSTAMAAVIASSTALAAVVTSSTAMTAIAASSTARTAVVASSTAMTAIAASSTAMAAVIASADFLSAVAASSTAMDACCANTVSRLAFYDSDAALQAIYDSATAVTRIRAAATFAVISQGSGVTPSDWTTFTGKRIVVGWATNYPGTMTLTGRRIGSSIGTLVGNSYSSPGTTAPLLNVIAMEATVTVIHSDTTGVTNYLATLPV